MTTFTIAVAAMMIVCLVIIGLCFLAIFCVVPNQRENELIKEINRMTEAGYSHDIITDEMGYVVNVKYYK